MKRIITLLFSIWIICLSFHAQTSSRSLLKGEGVFIYNQYSPFAKRPVEVHYYIPASGDQRTMPIIFVFQGGDRNYTYLLKAWEKEAEKKKFMVFIPQFDLKAYPLCDYQEIGVMNGKHTRHNPKVGLTPVLIDKMFEYIKQHTPTQRTHYDIYGHSAGGQFVQRFMLFHDSPYVDRAIIGSPGWYTFPDSSLNFPYGVKNIPYINRESIRKYLNKNIVLQLALGDTVRESFLRKTPEAELQGRNRYKRGLNFYRYIQETAHRNQWPCRWRKVEVSGVGHQSVEMGMEAIPLLLQDSPDTYHTPTLSLTDSTQFASVDDIGRYLKKLSQKYPQQAQLSSAGQTPEGLNIPILYLGKGDNPQKLKVWIQGGLHGNEPAAPEITCMLAGWLLQTHEGNEILSHIDIALLPVANPWGYTHQSRYSGNKLDLNRDQTKLADPVTALLKKAYLNWNPAIALDMHEYRPQRKEFSRLTGGHPTSIAYDILFLPSGHPNVATGLKELTSELFEPAARQALKQYGYTSNFYFTPRIIADTLYAVKDAQSPQSSSTWQALNNAVSLFIEIKGIGMGRTLFEKRVECGFVAARSILQTASQHQSVIKSSREAALAETMTGDKEVVVTFNTAIKQSHLKFTDLQNGKDFKRSLPTLDALQPQPILIRERPQAYLMTSANKAQVAKLLALGITVEVTEAPITRLVEKYIIEECQRSSEPWEQIHPVRVKTRVITENRIFPKGSYLIPTQQAGGNLLVTLLEPESENGFVAFEVIPVAKGSELPYYRILSN